jgi:adenylate cyclase
MNTRDVKRKLTAILSADVKDYSRLMGEDEVSTVRTLEDYRETMSTLIEQHRGRVVDSPGDNLMAEFASVVDAVQCAVEIQQALRAKNAELPENRRMRFRIGINLGDVIEEGDRIYGDGVNIAARIEGLAEPGGICISGNAYEQIENKLPLGYEYLGEHFVKNIAKPIRVYRVPMEPEGVAEATRRKKRAGLKMWNWAAFAGAAVLLFGAGAIVAWYYFLTPSTSPTGIPFEQTRSVKLPEKPSIAVLPFTNMSGDPEQEYFSDGVTEDLITGLSKVSGLFVIARNSVFTYKGRAVKIERVGQELGVRYVLEGSVRKADKRVRITAQLVDASTGGHLWAERYDRDLKDIFALQDEVTRKIVSALAVKLTEDEGNRIVRKGTDSLEAYDYTLRGQWYLSVITKEANDRAREMFEKAAALDPSYALAYSLLGRTYLVEWTLGWSQKLQSLEQAYEFAQKTVSLDDLLPWGHGLLGEVYLWKKRHDQAIAELEKASNLDPNNADMLTGLGEVLSWSGRPEEAIVLVKKAMRLNPIYPVWYLWGLGHAYFLAGRHEEAITTLKRVLNHNPNFLPAHGYLAASYVELGRWDDARLEAKRVHEMSPDLSMEGWRQRLPYKNQEVLDRLFNALRRTGLH